MNILHINGNYILSNLHQLMTRELSQRGINNTVYVPARKHPKINVKPDEGVIVSECFNYIDRYIFYYKQWKIIRDIQKKVDCSKFDCYHAYTVFTDGNVAYELSKKYDVPYVVAVRSTDVNLFFKRAVYLRSRGIEILNRAKIVFFLSETYREFVLENYIPECNRESIKTKSYVIPNGIDSFWHKNLFLDRDIDEIMRRFMQSKRLNLIFVGEITKRKNVSTTIKALKLMKDRGWFVSFTVIGEKKDNDEYNAIMSYDNTHYLGRKPKEEIIKYFRESDIFVMPSVTETFGLTYAEALTQGLPVIYTKGQGFDGQFEDGVVGYAVDCFSPEEMVERLICICNDYSRISRNCLSASKRFDWTSIVDKYLELYRGL